MKLFMIAVLFFGLGWIAYALDIRYSKQGSESWLASGAEIRCSENPASAVLSSSGVLRLSETLIYGTSYYAGLDGKNADSTRLSSRGSFRGVGANGSMQCWENASSVILTSSGTHVLLQRLSQGASQFVFLEGVENRP